MNVPPKNRSKHVALLLVIAVIFITAISMYIVGARANAQARSELGQRTQSIASALDSSHLLQLKGAPVDEKSKAYAELKNRLQAIKQSNLEARSIYLMGEKNGTVFFFVDSEKVGSRDYSQPGEAYADATPALQNIFIDGKSVVEGPVKDNFGNFISGLAPVYRNESHEVVAVLGIDLDAHAFIGRIATQASIPAGIGFTIICFIIFSEITRRHNQRLLETQSELVSVASHELRTPITGIRWASELLLTMPVEEKAKHLIKDIHMSAVALQSSTEEVLELSRAMRQSKLNPSRVNLAELVQSVMDVQQLAAQKRRVRVMWAGDIPKNVNVVCDADKVKRALHNVISNAIKYTREDTDVTLQYRQIKDMHEIIIRDHGIGIPKNEQSKVFAGFYRASNAVSSTVPGTGLGLYLVRTIFEQHHGSVQLESEENVGTSFTLALPIKAK